jgi:hypothetical protein
MSWSVARYGGRASPAGRARWRAPEAITAPRARVATWPPATWPRRLAGARLATRPSPQSHGWGLTLEAARRGGAEKPRHDGASC